MDVVEDVANILRIILDYIGLDADDLAEYMQQLHVRGRDAAHHFRGFLYNRWDLNVTQRRLRWHRWRCDVHNKNLIRIIGTSLPLKPPKRLKIQSHMIRSRRHRQDSWGSDFSTFSACTTSTDDDVAWVEEDLGDNCIRIRSAKTDGLSETELESETEEVADDLFLNRHDDIPLMNSTMITSVSMMSSTDPNAMHKINALEDELAKLREQMAHLVVNQEHMNKSTAPSIDTSTALPSPVSLHQPQALPPPPPPPPPTVMSSTPLRKNTDFKSMLQQKRDDLQKDSMDKRNTPDVVPAPFMSVPSMSDVLKGLGSVKLKSIQRSPGGTPLKGHTTNTNSSDPGSMIALALKKKFAHQNFHSPEVEKENESHEFSSADENSPHVPKSFVKKKAKRRSSLFDNRRKSHGPLRDESPSIRLSIDLVNTSPTWIDEFQQNFAAWQHTI